MLIKKKEDTNNELKEIRKMIHGQNENSTERIYYNKKPEIGS